MNRNDFKSLQTSRLLGIDDDIVYTEYMLSTRVRIVMFSEIISLEKEILSCFRNYQIFIFASNFHMAICTTDLPSSSVTEMHLFSNSEH